MFQCNDAYGGLGTPVYLDEGYVAVPQDRRLTIVQLGKDGEGTPVAEAQFAYEPLLFVFREGALIAAETHRFVRLLCWVGRKLKPLAIYMHDSLHVHGEVDEGLVLRLGKHAPFVSTPTGVDLAATYLLVEDPGPMLEALKPKPRAKKAKP
ncbi:MAG: hypothetical protein KF718_15280 [Polyangiaceae bacterium]|nr:hypothetical protein [Polyangiaceae bacterium]